MAFVKKTWKDRLVEYAGRRTLKRISGSPESQMVVDVTRNEGTVSQAGDAFSAANMNDLEQRILDGFTEVNNDLSQQPEWIEDSTGKIIGYKTPGGADTVFPFKGEILIKGSVANGNAPNTSSIADASSNVYIDVTDYSRLLIKKITNYNANSGSYVKFGNANYGVHYSNSTLTPNAEIDISDSTGLTIAAYIASGYKGNITYEIALS